MGKIIQERGNESFYLTLLKELRFSWLCGAMQYSIFMESIMIIGMM